MMRAVLQSFVIAAGLALCGCGGTPMSDPIVPLDQVPAPILTKAREALPGYTFDTAYLMNIDGKAAYEIRGKNKQGKVREVEIASDGTVLGIE
ncbi:PepSY domain-containing protein [Tundrisphaera sp. TA3]|uniref:PepSY domain-containing protein n=1 Tax=Tundrisphaera sp. TA3 TaxID=3435775 RepID=UPI003EB7604A